MCVFHLMSIFNTRVLNGKNTNLKISISTNMEKHIVIFFFFFISPSSRCTCQNSVHHPRSWFLKRSSIKSALCLLLDWQSLLDAGTKCLLLSICLLLNLFFKSDLNNTFITIRNYEQCICRFKNGSVVLCGEFYWEKVHTIVWSDCTQTTEISLLDTTGMSSLSEKPPKVTKHLSDWIVFLFPHYHFAVAGVSSLLLWSLAFKSFYYWLFTGEWVCFAIAADFLECNRNKSDKGSFSTPALRR